MIRVFIGLLVFKTDKGNPLRNHREVNLRLSMKRRQKEKKDRYEERQQNRHNDRSWSLPRLFLLRKPQFIRKGKKEKENKKIKK